MTLQIKSGDMSDLWWLDEGQENREAGKQGSEWWAP